MRTGSTKPFYILLDVIFITLYAGVLLALYYLGRLPRGISVLDFVLLGLAAARLSDVISTDDIMQWLREPFVGVEEEQIAGEEVQTRVGRGRGIRKVLGELLCCPWCVGVWVAAGLTYAYFLLPRIIWLFLLLMAIAEVGSLLQTFSTILVSVEKYLKSICRPDEAP
mgnify:CR=1 FL=1